MKVIVNAKEILCFGEKKMDYENAVYHAFGDDCPAGLKFTVTYRLPKTNIGGTLGEDEEVEIHEGMVFNVANTSNA